MTRKHLISCIIIILLSQINANAQLTENEVKEVLFKTNESLKNITATVFKVNHKRKFFSKNDTIYTTAICTLQLAPKDRMGAYNIIDMEFAEATYTAYGHRRYDGNGVFWVNYAVGRDNTAVKPQIRTNRKDIKGIVENYKSILLPEYFAEKTAFNSLRLFGVKTGVTEEVYLNTPVYVITMTFKDNDGISDNIEKHYIRKSDYLPIGYFRTMKWEGMQQYDDFKIEYLAVNPDIPASAFAVNENDTIDAAARYAALAEKANITPKTLTNNNSTNTPLTQVAVAPADNLNNSTGADASQNLPDFNLKLHNNNTLNLKDLKGKVVLLDFWYRGCAPCLMAIPELMELQEEFKDDLVIIGINGFDIQEDVVGYIEYKKMNYASTYKTGDNLIKNLNLNVEGYPTTILYDRQGNFIKTDTGYSKGGIRSLRSAIKKALK
jgi:thiol-disulfide isomerase/thioredoxin